jgi:hypothetical protein
MDAKKRAELREAVAAARRSLIKDEPSGMGKTRATAQGEHGDQEWISSGIAGEVTREKAGRREYYFTFLAGTRAGHPPSV